jgi:signal transduction histidine kinase
VRPIRLRSITIELMILFVVVLTLAETLSLGYRYLDRADALSALEAIRIADRVAVITALIEKAPPQERPQLIRDFQGSDLSVTLTAQPWLRSSETDNNETILLHDLLRRVIPRSVATDIYASYLTSKDPLPAKAESKLAMRWRKAGRFPEPISHVIDKLTAKPTLLVALRLNDGSWLNVVAAYVEDINFWPLRTMLILTIMVVGMAALSIWAIARLTAPLKDFASAAIRLGTDVNAIPIAERGPADVRGAIRAFNEMQTRLKRFVEDRTQMLAAVSHDLRTPITRLRLRAEWVVNKNQRSKFLADLDEMEHMIAGVLSFAKEEAHPEPTVSLDLIAMLQSICDDLVDKGFKVSFKAEGHLDYQCRPVSIRRCFSNLLDNALKYGQRADVSVVAGTTDVRIQIDDYGPGIPEALREEVFRPFHRLEWSRNRDSGGSGLGLTVARTVARAHGGDVLLGEGPRGGLRATIVLPRISVSLAALPPDPGAVLEPEADAMT